MTPHLHRPAGMVGDGTDPVSVLPKDADWTYAGLRVVRLDPGKPRALRTDGIELAVLPLTGSCVVEVDGRRFVLEGRQGVWDRVTDFVYVPVGSEVRLLSGTGGEFALPNAQASRRFDPVRVAAADVAVEVRGAGQATRQVTNFLSPEAPVEADKLIAVEVYTPEGNWSSYPPHKHDGLPGGPAGCEEAVLEEIYYFRIRGEHGFGLHRTYAADGAFDKTVAVRDGDVFLVPSGFHGPCVAPPGYDMYYLNVLAGPAETRSMAFCTDPAHLWVWEAWKGAARDPRCPLVRARGHVEQGAGT